MCAGKDGGLVIIRDEDKADSPLGQKARKRQEDEIKAHQAALGIKFIKNDVEKKEGGK